MSRDRRLDLLSPHLRHSTSGPATRGSGPIKTLVSCSRKGFLMGGITNSQLLCGHPCCSIASISVLSIWELKQNIAQWKLTRSSCRRTCRHVPEGLVGVSQWINRISIHTLTVSNTVSWLVAIETHNDDALFLNLLLRTILGDMAKLIAIAAFAEAAADWLASIFQSR
ncbi:hypothetical protein F5Y07DRAFT_96286 [Xylaria sp. FL0933]|nr:hypothetical protein F5Y07DRAFT_96286 [Xylaria sp. FL0933]